MTRYYQLKSLHQKQLSLNTPDKNNYLQLEEKHNPEPTELTTFAQQIQSARSDVDTKKEAAKKAYQTYTAFMDQPVDTTYSILDDNGVAAARAEQERKNLWSAYTQANAAATKAQTDYQEMLENYTSRMATSEKDNYYAMDLGDLKTLLDNKKADVETKRVAAVTAQNNYGAFLDQPVTGNFLEEDMSLSADLQAQQKALLQAATDATNALNQAMDAHDLMEDIYNERNDMLVISGMTDTEKIALEIYHNGLNIAETVHMINSLSKEQRGKLRDTGKLFQILTDPKKYLRDAGYAEKDLSRLKETYGRYLNARDMQQLQETTISQAKEQPVLQTVATYPTKLVGDVVGGLTSLGSTIWHDMGLSHYNSIDVNSPLYAATVYSDTVRDTVSDDLGEFGGAVYNSINNVVDNGLRTAALGPWGASAADALGSFGSSARETAIKGGTNQEAFFVGASNAGLDLLLNTFSVDQLLDTSFAGKWQSLLDYGISGAESLTEEELRYLGDLAVQTAVLAEDSDFYTQIAALMQTGLSEEEAKKEVYKSIFKKMNYIALESQISNSMSSLP